MSKYYYVFLLLLFIVILISAEEAQQASFHTITNKKLVGEFIKIDDDTVHVRVTKQNGLTNIKKIKKTFFTKIIIYKTGEEIDLSLSNLTVPHVTENDKSWDDINTDNGLSNEVDNPVIKRDDARFTVAVTEFDSRGALNADEIKSLADRFREKLMETNKFRMMERNEMDLILHEIGFQQTGACKDDECLVEIGQLIAVQKIVSASVGKVGGIYTVSVKMLDVATGAIDKTVSEDCDCPIEELLTVTMERVAKKLAGMEVKKKNSVIEVKRGDASIFVKTNIDGARVYIDGKLMDGVTPLTIENLISGEHTVRTIKGNLTATKNITLSPNKVGRIEMTLEERSTLLKISTEPSEAEIYINNKPGKKVKPDQITPAIFENFESDTAKITVFKLGYVDTTINIPITKNEDNMFTIKLRKVNPELISTQKKMVKSRKKRTIGIGLTIPGLAIAAGGGLMYYLASRDYQDAKELKTKLNASVIKDGEIYNNMIKENSDLTSNGNLKTILAASMWGIGGIATGIGIVLQF